MSAVKFVHVLKKIESLERDIDEIKGIQSDINPDRAYSTPLRISLEQAVNNLLNEKVKLMEVRIENPPENLDVTKKQGASAIEQLQLKNPVSFEDIEKEYYSALKDKRRNYAQQGENITEEPAKAMVQQGVNLPVKSGTPSLAEKSIEKIPVKKPESTPELPKRRSDILKNLPPLEL